MASGKAGAGLISATVLGALLCLGLIFLAIAATIILSLISIFTPNHSQVAEGEEYRASYLMFKLLYTNTSSDNYTGAPIADNTYFSNLASSLALAQDTTNVYGALLTNGQAYGPYNSSNSTRRRRRSSTTVGIYAVYTLRFFFRNKCSKNSDVGSYYGSSSTISTCVSRRLRLCNNLFNNSAQTFVDWSNSPSFTVSVYDSKLTAWTALVLSQIFAVTPVVAYNIASRFSQLSGAQTSLLKGCQYYGGISLTSIQSAISAQSSETTTTPATTTVVG